MINGVEIFSGAGGLAKGLAIAGVNHRVLVERNRHACCTLRENFGGSEIYEGDIRDFDFGRLNDIDLLAGGPPCQPFSLGGKAKGDQDERDMFPYAVDAIRVISPKAFIFENVKGLLRETFRDYFEYILLQLQFPQIQLVYEDWQENYKYLRERTVNYRPTYNVTYNLVNAADYGVPQKRERVI
ncbi:MAG: DNA (cytosine-5-)-methyltransferase, partial [Bacteroidales bacterium]|nr:DNA (cytosine-5-)-methyltransferase [Bacteroidales bacterium]